MDLNEFTDDVIAGRSVTPGGTLAVLRPSNAEILALAAAAGRVRHHYLDATMKVNYLINFKSGLCPEDCFHCSQRFGSQADILKHRWLRNEGVVAAVKAGVAGGAKQVCLMASGYGPSNRDINEVTEITGGIKAEHPGVEIRAYLRQPRGGQPEQLTAAGAGTYSHNPNTAESHYDNICITYSYQDRTETVQHAREYGPSVCSGLIAGIGESDEQLVKMAFALRGIDVDSVPVNFLTLFDGTPLVGHAGLSPQRCLHILMMIRFVHSGNGMWVTAGREQYLRSLQPLSLEICNSLFFGDYLTSEEQAGTKDLTMITDCGLTVLDQEEISPKVDVRPVIRSRGVETPEPMNV